MAVPFYDARLVATVCAGIVQYVEVVQIPLTNEHDATMMQPTIDCDDVDGDCTMSRVGS